MAEDIPLEKRRLYGRRIGRPLGSARQDAIDNLLPKLSFSKNDLETGQKINPLTCFDKAYPKMVFEIGFGDGEHLTAMLQKDVNTAFIGAEPFINGMASLLTQVTDKKLDHSRIRLWMDDAIMLLENFTDTCLDEIYILNPDPWPKARHYKRRIVSSKNLDLFSRLLKRGGRLIMTTDVDDLAEWMITQTVNHRCFTWSAKSSSDWKNPPKDWIETKYERRGKIAGRRQSYLIFIRI